MNAETVVARLNEIDGQVCRALGINRSFEATTLDEAIRMAAASTDRLSFGGFGIRDAAGLPDGMLSAYLQAQVDAHWLRVRDRADVVRTLTDGIRRMKEAESLLRLGSQARSELCDFLGFDNALLSFVEDDGFVVEESHRGLGGPTVIPGCNCVAERDCIRLQDTIRTDEIKAPAAPGYRELLGSGDYLVAPVIVKSRVVALFHVSRVSQGGITANDRHVLDSFASGYSLLYERGVNSERVHQQRASIARAAARLTEEANRIAAASICLDAETTTSVEAPTIAADSALAAALSERERQVFERLILGASNAAIAEELVITVETVKTHVKRILRKIGAINRSEAIALYMEDTSGRPRRRCG